MKTGALITGWKLFWLFAAILLGLCAVLLAADADRTLALHLLIRVTAYTSFAPFLAAFLATPLATLAPNGFTRGLLRERRYLGLSFAFSMLVHLAAIFSYGAMNPQFWPSRGFLANTPGTIGYVFIGLLAATSFRVISRHISSASWRRLHLIGVWVIATIFGLSFLKRIPTVSPVYAVPFAILVGAMVIRVIGKRAQARRREGVHVRSISNANQALESMS